MALNPAVIRQVGDTVIVTDRGEALWNTRQVLGGTFELTPATDSPGQYQLAWSAGVLWQGKAVRIEASPITLERTR